MAASNDAIGTALRVLGTATIRGHVTSHPGAVVVHATHLEDSEIRWLFLGMTTPDIRLNLDGGPEDTVIDGWIHGRRYKVKIVARVHAGLLGDLRLALSEAQLRARAVASAR